ncbi:MAG: pentapeptide repeat-containing protein [Methylocystaceae bacterium]|nr:pentapeptide repeat-containing protein [Methylocystaceae bacterium]
MTDFEFSKYKVLMCDTDPEVIDIARTTYLDADIGDFVATPSPEEALKHIPRMKPDVILVALKLPNISGINLIQKIRSMNEGAFYKTPVLMLLEKVSQNLLREACRAGIEGALRKPIQPEKIKRFSRAVILKPRRFICVRHYFGPERRSRDDPHFGGKDRRSGLSQDDFSTDSFTRNQTPITPGRSSLDSSPVLSGGLSESSTRDNRTNDDSQDFDWGNSTTTTKSDGGVLDYSSPEFKNTSAAGTSSDRPFDFGTSQETPASKEISYDFTSEDRMTASKDDIDYGQSKEKSKTKTEIKTDSEAKPEPKEKAPVAFEETGPDSDEFEEIMDLEECLDLHKLWINSGGKSGQQANRPHSDFRGQELDEADFTRAILPQSNFEDVNCTNTVFRKADLTGSTFKKALLSSADLRVSRLAKADMREARMDKANLLGADLTGANLEGATLRGVNLSGANLNRTNLRGVNLSSARGLIPEQIKRAITDQGTLLPLSVRTAP